VDALNRQINRELAEHMMDNRDTIIRCLSLIIVSKSLERIADHAKNVAEEVVYLYEAQDIRHPAKSGSGAAVWDQGAG
jgi:phosphate transport system protein